MAGLAAHGTKLYWGLPLGDATLVGEITNIGGPTTKVDTIDVTSHDSQGWREFVAGLGDYGEITADINFHPANVVNNQMLFFDDMVAKTRNTLTIEIPADPNMGLPEYYFYGEAMITGFPMAAPFDDKLSATVTFKLSGLLTHGTTPPGS
jgi:predicted secreted protein